jgi:hypothetical protein
MLKTLLVVCICSTLTFSQSRKKQLKLFHFSLSPGISTNGVHGSDKTNEFSFNFTSGYTGATNFLELALISNANELKTRGLQVAGLVNVTGINAYKGLSEKEIDQKYRSGFEANMIGAQFSGLINSVLSNAYGWQATGGVNIVRNALFGFQLAGLSNVVYKYSFGFQLAGLTNTSYQSMDGVQMATLSNYTDGGLYGLQLSLFNRAGFIEGKNGYENSDYTGWQIGLVNKAKERMNGYQIGLVNIGGRMQGTQIGLINIYRRGKEIGTRDGTAIGLINIGDFGHLSVYNSELFPFNIEIATGNRKNGRILETNKNKYVLNSLIYSKGSNWLVDKDAQWALGYALRKYNFNRSQRPGMNELWFYAYGISIQQLNEAKKKLTKELNLISKPELLIGSRIIPKNSSIYFFALFSWNAYLHKDNAEQVTTDSEVNFDNWPGFSIGVMAH